MSQICALFICFVCVWFGVHVCIWCVTYVCVVCHSCVYGVSLMYKLSTPKTIIPQGGRLHMKYHQYAGSHPHRRLPPCAPSEQWHPHCVFVFWVCVCLLVQYVCSMCGVHCGCKSMDGTTGRVSCNCLHNQHHPLTTTPSTTTHSHNNTHPGALALLCVLSPMSPYAKKLVCTSGPTGGGARKL